MKGRSLCPDTPPSLAVPVSSPARPPFPRELLAEEQKSQVSWRAPSLHMTPDNMSQHVTMITSHSDKNCSLHCNIQTKVRH